MILNKLTLHNFRLHKDLSINFQSPGTTLLVAPNGYGKSTVVEALTWVLFGSNTLRTNQDDITTDGEDITSVALDFNIKDINYLLVRTRNGKCITDADLFKNGVNIEDTLSGVGKALSELFLSKDKFSIGCVNQGEVDSLVFLQPNKKKLLLSSLFNLSVIDEVLEVISKDYDKIKSLVDSEDCVKKLLETETLIKEKSQKLQECFLYLDAHQEKLKSLEIINETQIKQSLSKSLLEKELGELTKSKQFIEPERSLLEADLHKIPNIDDLILELSDLQQDINDDFMSVEWINGFNRFLTCLERDLKFKEAGHLKEEQKCPFCFQSLISLDINKLIDIHNKATETTQKEKEELEKNIHNITNQITNLSKKIQALTAKQHNLSDKLLLLNNEHTSLLLKIKEITEQLTLFKEDVNVTPLKIIEVSKSLADYKSKERILIETISRYKVELEYHKKDIDYYTKLAIEQQALSEEISILYDTKQSIKLFRVWALNSLLEYVLSRTNYLLYELTNKNWNIHCTEDLDFLALDSKPVERFSEGQMCMIAVALRIATAEYLAIKANYYGPLILDGIFDVLDDRNRGKLCNLLNKLKFPQIILLSHFDPQGVVGERIYL